MKSLASAPDTRIALMLAGIAVVLIGSSLLGRLVQRINQPAVVGEVLAGLLLGPSVLGLLPGDPVGALFPTEVRPLLSAVAQIGLVLFMFLVGWEFEKQVYRRTRTIAATISLVSIACTFTLGLGLGLALHGNHSLVDDNPVSSVSFAIFMGAAMSVTAFPVLGRILADSGLMRTRIGSLALAGAAIDDVIAWCMLACVSAIVTTDGDLTNLWTIILRSAVYLTIMFVLVRPLLELLVARLAERRQWAQLLVVLSAGAMLSAALTTWIGIHAFFGAFLFGFIMPRAATLSLTEHVRHPLRNVTVMLLPVFFVVTGLGVDIRALGARQYLELAAIITVACIGKFFGVFVPARLCGLPRSESRVLGLLMNTRGLTELIMLNAGSSLGIIDQQTFTMMVIMALVTTAVTGPLLARSTVMAQQTQSRNGPN